ncbi:uncharacterized protein GABPI isoform X2 [Maniola hyperantus]|uniref:uncharacterized protein GABPI isoform X2 n=1 Tax=Aphantopus hyperantus TaxID=2795564 RepID=UPI0037497C1B
MVIPMMTAQDVSPYGPKVTKKVDLDAVLPFVILPLLLVIATISRSVTIVVMILIAMGATYAQSRPRNKNRSPFFYSWTLSSDFELATGTSKGKEYSPVLTSDSYYCQICQLEVNERFFHSIWWDCCVLRPNYSYFLAGQVFAFATLLYGTNLGLTTVCQPFILYGTILMPEDCNDVYFDFNLAICFVACVYGLGYLLVTALVLIRQLLIYIPKYSEPQWRKIVNVLTV